MNITLGKHYYARPDSKLLGYMGETESRTIKVQGYQIDGADVYKLRLAYPDGVQYDVDVTSGEYTVHGSLLRMVGEVKCQLLAVKVTDGLQEYVKKSQIFALSIGSSVSGDPPIPTYEQAAEALEKVLEAELKADECIDSAAAAKTSEDNAAASAEQAATSAQSAAENAAKTAQDSMATAADRQAVEQAATETLSARDTAVSSAETATEKAQIAVDSAATASTANAAAQSAKTAAEQAATSAEDNKTTAVNAANTAVESAQTANSAADTAVSARDTATAAADTAESARTAAETAKTTAETAATTATEKATEISASAEQISTNAADISGLKSDLESYTKNIGLYGDSYNIVDLTKITNGYYIKPDGSVNSNASYSYTDFIPVTEGDVIVSWKFSGSRWVENIESIRFIAAYDSNKRVISDSGAEKQFEYVVPSGVSYIILSCNTSNLENKILMILRNYTQTPSEYIEYVQGEYKGKASFISHDMALEIEDISFGKTQSIRRCRGGFIASGDLSEDIVFPNNSVNGRYRIVVNAKITALGTIAIGRKHGSTSYGYFEIDGSEIRWYSTGTTLTKTYTHGLTIGKECAIIIETNPSPASAYRQYEHRVTVVSGGQSYATENIVIQNFSKGKTCYIHADNSTLSVDASFTFYNAKSPVYAFGDSYFTWGPARWTGYLYDDGFADNVLTDAFAGRGSTDALESFKNLECAGIPSYVLWCMGMNDADTAESVNSNWQTAYDYVCDYCDNHHIELILATIPEVTNASYRNDMKNSVVRNSGRRYVDFARAVNAETVGSAWYDGMLASDGVHPTESGARTLYNQIIVDFPEIMLFN